MDYTSIHVNVITYYFLQFVQWLLYHSIRNVVKLFWNFLARQLRISRFLSKKRLGVLLFPLDGMLVYHSLLSHPSRSFLEPIYNWVKKGAATGEYYQEYNTRARTQTTHSRVQQTNTQTNHSTSPGRGTEDYINSPLFSCGILFPSLLLFRTWHFSDQHFARTVPSETRGDIKTETHVCLPILAYKYQNVSKQQKHLTETETDDGREVRIKFGDFLQ